MRHAARQLPSWLIFDVGQNMKTHIIWFCVSVAAFVIGLQFAKTEVRVVEKPVEVVKTKEVFVERPVERSKANSAGSEKIAEQKIASPIVDKRNSAAERAKLHQRYDSFLSQLGLTAVQVERFVELKLAIYEAQDDLQAAVAQNSVPGGASGVEAMRKQLTEPMWNEIRHLLGEDGFRAYPEYERMSGFRPTVTSLFGSVGVAVYS